MASECELRLERATILRTRSLVLSLFVPLNRCRVGLERILSACNYNESAVETMRTDQLEAAKCQKVPENKRQSMTADLQV
jgi:hypothetical protein